MSIALNNLSMDGECISNSYLNLIRLRKAYLGSLLSPQKSQFGLLYLGKSGSLNRGFYGNPAFGIGMPYPGSPLVDNNFTGNVDNAFRKCLNLTDLFLSGNHLFAEIPAYPGELQLVTLELSKNNLYRKIPHRLWDSRTLMEISLNSNLLKGQISVAIAKVSTLQGTSSPSDLLK
ncbi:hypothetical protein F0562_025088 [Nyssa sinensis]|uniref:Nucleic acid binding NABP domain-containing protein n=1 Tax=Nyssa sinensis TaxID=561372 RepID=A0A5J5AHX7_9ASTE|nr:hypothetical protein F0562_036096 [Nyssa sinensis]KAA8541166.1 hypothetical protein F0562_025088 [Nyssa sinensis]